MATGTGNLPKQDMEFNPFDPLPASQLNDLVENIESLADGSGIGDEAIGASNILPPLTSAGILNISTTGNKTVSGLPFKPSVVEFTPLYTTQTAVGFSSGGMTETDQWATTTSGTISNVVRGSATNRCIWVVSAAAGATLVAGERVSINDDGFTINITSAEASSTQVAWRAYL